jgi:signal transduction histidine kinase
VSLTSVLLISAEPEFASTVIARWQCERTVPGFVTLGALSAADTTLSTCDLAILGPAPSEALVAILRVLDAAGRPAICLVPDSATASTFRHAHSRAFVLREHEGWPDNLVTLGSEVLRRIELGARCRRAEQALAEAEQTATLGRYMLDMRHSLNNALTSILGNSELLLLEPGALSANERDQITTMHSMTLRIHEILQRFTSMELEMKLYSQSHHEIPLLPRTMIATSATAPELAGEEANRSRHQRRVS